jgi:acyl-CoA synthetase (AMP-forming)/AMP-acid ligase II
MLPTFVDILKTRAEENPDQQAYLFLIDGEHEGPRLSYGQLDAQARSIAVALRRAIGQQERALLVYPPGLDFVAAFFGCLYAGVTAVPLYPPRPDILRPGAQPLAAFAADCQPAAVLGTGEILAELQSIFSGHPALAAADKIATDQLDASAAHSWRAPPLADDWLAMLQYTSGSTRSPRGVMVSHASLMHNQQVMQTAVEHKGPGSGVTWLPPYHDLGLIGGILQSTFHGALCIMMSPISFLQQPFRWLAAISRYRADTSGGPGFAYDYCVQRVTPEQRQSLDLSRWSVALIGAEPIHPDTLERFSDAFGTCGFQPQTWYPAYGLAEATLLVTGSFKSDPPCVRKFDRRSLEAGQAVPAASSDAVRLAGSGHVWGGQRVAIVDPERLVELSSGRVGEVWVAGPSVARGYWNRPEETQATFRAHLSETGEGPFLRTGDLGFMLEGELFITGRLKDLIVVHGRNHAPQDIEDTVQAVHPALRAGCGAAFETRPHGQARLIVVQEVDRRGDLQDPAILIGQVRQAIRERHDLHLHELVLVQPGSIPKTSSGKVQRYACRAAYETDRLLPWKERPRAKKT